ncbi:hypothetical protein AXG93_4360s1300 [Marchantia polymorpha subsp. ruderalis]|uniref:Uncharacterized protein n=1 Tax=Marchantia polymorpha subsp. ruderalis TaxID=1480154 RepID=A0A176W3X8_MARPO|nr:hypothetical protein AXG93_4360s1300 [Marchantia polymorpha subsp. ruderalis]
MPIRKRMQITGPHIHMVAHAILGACWPAADGADESRVGAAEAEERVACATEVHEWARGSAGREEEGGRASVIVFTLGKVKSASKRQSGMGSASAEYARIIHGHMLATGE